MESAPSYKGHRCPVEIISHCVWLYHRCPLSFREVEELVLERGVTVSYETVRRWCLKFGQDYANRRCQVEEALDGVSRIGTRSSPGVVRLSEHSSGYRDHLPLIESGQRLRGLEIFLTRQRRQTTSTRSASVTGVAEWQR